MASNRGFNIIEAGERTADVESPSISNLNNSAAHFIVGLTAITTGSITLEVYGVTVSGLEYRLFRTLPMVSVGTYRSALSPGQMCVPGIVCRDFIPTKFKLKVVHETADPITYLVDVELGEGV